MDLPDFVSAYPNLASERLGAEVVLASDDFFADKARLIQDDEAVFYPDKYDDHGKWMDGWESRRRRGPGHDFCLIRLGEASAIYGVCIDTSHFTGNYPPGASIDVARSENMPSEEDWQPLLNPVELRGDKQHYFGCSSEGSWNWLRLNIFPDGGVARLRVYGRPSRDWENVIRSGDEVELSGLLNGGRILGYSDAHYGSLWTLLAPDTAKNMGDGWETRRRREPGNDWLILALGHRGEIQHGQIDTSFFKGNFPAAFSLQAADLGGVPDSVAVTQSMFWEELTPKMELSADSVLAFEVEPPRPSTHVRLNIYPDGGVSRLRLFGRALTND